MRVESPGTLRHQIGRSLNAIQDAVQSGDVWLVADLTALLVAKCSPKLSVEEEAALQVPEMEGGRDRDGSKRRALFRQCLAIQSRLLRMMSERGYYAWHEEAAGDASGLALSDEEDGLAVSR